MKRNGWIAGTALSLALLLAGCGKSTWVYKPITDVENLGGRRVGANLAWEADYLLTGRKDLEIFRYDDTSGMVMALNANKVDAVSMDELVWKMADAVTEGIDKVEPAFTSAGYVCYVGRDRDDLRLEFNDFLQEFRNTPEYAQLVRYREEFDGAEYNVPEVPLTGTGDLLRVALITEGYPRSFIKPGAEQPAGFDVEFVKYFANARNYRLELTATIYDDIVMGLQHGLYDLGVGYLSDCYYDDVIASGLNITEAFDESKLYFVEKTQEKIQLHGSLD